MTERADDAARQTAISVGEQVEGCAAWVVDRLENLSLAVMERIAEAAPRSELVAELHRVVIGLHRLAAPVPHLAGRVAAGTCFGLRMGLEMYRETRDGMHEVTGHAAADETARKP